MLGSGRGEVCTSPDAAESRIEYLWHATGTYSYVSWKASDPKFVQDVRLPTSNRVAVLSVWPGKQAASMVEFETYQNWSLDHLL